MDVYLHSVLSSVPYGGEQVEYELHVIFLSKQRGIQSTILIYLLSFNYMFRPNWPSSDWKYIRFPFNRFFYPLASVYINFLKLIIKYLF
jgi:hypothetical protein